MIIIIDNKTDLSVKIHDDTYIPKKDDVIEYNIGNKHINGIVTSIRHSNYMSIHGDICNDIIITVH